ncbi:MAG: recombinase family protein [Oscillospiraceae bacterium]|nr:recombinase family protein [Oscillospiraceae bacterium]
MNRQTNTKKGYLYGRLSKEDEKHGDSYRIENQEKILAKYAEENGFTHCEFIYDDGYSGGDGERPAFCKMIEDVEAGFVSTIIVNDLSRFGRSACGDVQLIMSSTRKQRKRNPRTFILEVVFRTAII